MEEIKPDFVLAAGDDETDETVFAALPPDAYTVKVGRGKTLAKYYLPNYRAVREVLRLLLAAWSPLVRFRLAQGRDL